MLEQIIVCTQMVPFLQHSFQLQAPSPAFLLGWGEILTLFGSWIFVESSSGDSFPAHYRSWVPASRQPVPRCAHQHHRPPGLCQLPHLWKTLGWQLHHQERGQEIAGERDCLWRRSGDSQLLLGMPRSAGEESTSTLWILWGEYCADGWLLRGTRSSEVNVAPPLKSHFRWNDHKDQQTNDLDIVGFSLTPILFAWTVWNGMGWSY